MNKLLISLLSLVAVGAIGTSVAYGAGAFEESEPPYGKGVDTPPCKPEDTSCDNKAQASSIQGQ